MGIGYFVISQTNPDIFDELKDINLGNLDAAIDFITQNSNIIYPLISVSNSVGIFAGIMFAQAEFRKNEMSFYGINTILSDNKQRISPTTMTVMIFRKELYPSVKKKHDAIDIKLNWLGYLLYCWSSYRSLYSYQLRIYSYDCFRFRTSCLCSFLLTYKIV